MSSMKQDGELGEVYAAETSEELAAVYDRWSDGYDRYMNEGGYRQDLRLRDHPGYRSSALVKCGLQGSEARKYRPRQRWTLPVDRFWTVKTGDFRQHF